MAVRMKECQVIEQKSHEQLEHTVLKTTRTEAMLRNQRKQSTKKSTQLKRDWIGII